MNENKCFLYRRTHALENVENPSFVAVCRSCWKSDMELSLRKYGKGVLIRGKISEEEAFLTHHST